MNLKLLRHVVFTYGFVVALIVPAIRISSYFTGWGFISFRDYVLMVLSFLVAVLYLDKLPINKKEGDKKA